MRFPLLLLSLSLIAVSCNKTQKVESTDSIETTDSIAIIQNAGPLQERSAEEISSLLQTSNDTLYVTNFFATWCGPCIRELPHFVSHMKELDGKKVKFTFVSLDEKDVWNTKVPEFVAEHGISEHSVLLDGYNLEPDFYSKNFSTWDGSSIPFTLFKQGDKEEEVIGMMTGEHMQSMFASFDVK